MGRVKWHPLLWGVLKVYVSISRELIKYQVNDWTSTLLIIWTNSKFCRK